MSEVIGFDVEPVSVLGKMLEVWVSNDPSYPLCVLCSISFYCLLRILVGIRVNVHYGDIIMLVHKGSSL